MEKKNWIPSIRVECEHGKITNSKIFPVLVLYWSGHNKEFDTKYVEHECMCNFRANLKNLRENSFWGNFFIFTRDFRVFYDFIHIIFLLSNILIAILFLFVFATQFSRMV